MASQQRIRVGEFFRDFDKLRSGFITNSQFRIGLNMSKIPISHQELQLLASHFKAQKEGDHVCWKDFVDCVDQVFTKKELEKDHAIVLGDARVQTVYGKAGAQDEDRSVVSNIVDRFRDVVRKHRLDAKSFFQDFDHHRHFKVSPKIFR